MTIRNNGFTVTRGIPGTIAVQVTPTGNYLNLTSSSLEDIKIFLLALVEEINDKLDKKVVI